jgi:hypothetical protein
MGQHSLSWKTRAVPYDAAVICIRKIVNNLCALVGERRKYIEFSCASIGIVKQD